MANNENAPPLHRSTPDPALKRLEKLVGTWRITGHLLDSQDDTISGRVIIEWLPGGFFLQQRGEMELLGFTVQSLEIVGYDPATKTFPSSVYSNLEGAPHPYHWDVQDNSVTHWDEEAKYTGTFSKDGTTLSGGWRPEEGKEGPGNIGYDATMIRVEDRN